jgi:N-formylglutamate amidohydrolase
MQTKEGILTSYNTIPEWPLVFDSPHSGRVYPDEFDYACDAEMLVRAEDTFVDDLFAHVTGYGAAFLAAEFPRTYIDVNRRENDIDQAILDRPWPTQLARDGRAHAGTGVIRRLVKPGIPLYARQLGHEEVMHRIQHYYRPYHDTLQALLDDCHYRFGRVWHINCHAMPAHTAYPRSTERESGEKAFDFVLGDLDGTSCIRDLRVCIRDSLTRMGYRVGINDPYKGVEIVRRYGRPRENRHSIQLEINKALYMDETACVPNANYEALCTDLKRLTADLAEFVRTRCIDMAAD